MKQDNVDLERDQTSMRAYHIGYGIVAGRTSTRDA